MLLGLHLLHRRRQIDGTVEAGLHDGNCMFDSRFNRQIALDDHSGTAGGLWRGVSCYTLRSTFARLGGRTEICYAYVGEKGSQR